MTAREFWMRLLGLFRRRDGDADLEDEMAAHLELAAAENLARGMTPDEARRQAAIRFGSVASAREGAWQQGWLPGPGSFLQDTKYALRAMKKSPGFTVTALLTVGLGIGLCSIMFTILNSYLLRPLSGVPDPKPLVMVQEMATYPQFERWRDHSGAASAMAALIGPAPFGVEAGGAGSPRVRVMGQLVSPEYFATLGVEPLAGRFFGGDAWGAAQVVVTERFWRTRLHADLRAVGSTLQVNGRPAIIIGVGPKDFFGIGTGLANVAEIFLPLHADPAIAPELAGEVLHRTRGPAFRVVMRLAEGMTLPGAEARLDTQSRAYDDRQRKGQSIRLMPAGTQVPMPREARAMVATFYGFLFALILLMMSANLGGLLLARGSARAREIAIRLSIGAGRFRLIRQLVTESVILALLGGAVGLAAGYALLQAVINIWGDANAIPFVQRPDMDWRVAAFACLLSAIAACGFGLVPALAVTRPDVATALKTAPGTSTGLRSRRFRLRNLFVVCQMAAAMMLVMIMGFVMLGMRSGLKREAGFDTSRLALFSVDPARDGLTPPECDAALTRLPEALAHVAGVEGVTLADRAPVSDASAGTSISVVPLTAGASEVVRLVSLQRVGNRYFSTVGAPLVRGAEFRETAPRSGAMPPAVVNQTAAQALFGGTDPVGRRLRYDGELYEVTGVARYDPPMVLLNRPVPTVFLPLIDHTREVTVVARWRGQPDLPALRKSLAMMDGRLTMMRERTLQTSLAESERSNRVIAAFYVPIGGFGLVLACVGLAGVTAQAVQRRRKEIGIRMALGAQRRELLRLVMKEGAAMMTVGAACGFAGAYGMARVLSAAFAPMAEVIGAGAGNPLLVVGVPVLLISLAVMACYLPARRSATVDPLLALREE